jgi:hypothetical protein
MTAQYFQESGFAMQAAVRPKAKMLRVFQKYTDATAASRA